MKLESLSKSNNLEMQQFCEEEINRCKNSYKHYETLFFTRGYESERKYLSHSMGVFVRHLNYYNYFLHLLQEEYKNYKDSNIKQVSL